VRKVLRENTNLDLEAELPGGSFGATALLQAVYANNVAAGTDPDAVTRGVGQALGEIAVAAYSVKP